MSNITHWYPSLGVKDEECLSGDDGQSVDMT